MRIDTDLVLLAMGFVHPQKEGLLEQLGVALDGRGNVQTDADKMTSIDGVFAAGDMARGQSLVVWALAEGREAARGVDLFLMGRDVPATRTCGSDGAVLAEQNWTILKIHLKFV